MKMEDTTEVGKKNLEYFSFVIYCVHLMRLKEDKLLHSGNFPTGALLFQRLTENDLDRWTRTLD